MARGNIHYDQIRDDHRQGNGSKIAMSAVASPASNDVVLYDANGNLIKLAKGSANQVLAMKGDGSAPVFKSLTAGSGASISHSDSEITIAATGGGGGGGGGAVDLLSDDKITAGVGTLTSAKLEYQSVSNGATQTLLNYTGGQPGYATLLWVAVPKDGNSTVRNWTLKIYIDGESSPTINCPLPVFAAAEYASESSVPSVAGKYFIVSKGTNYIGYAIKLPIPFSTDLKIDLVNGTGGTKIIFSQVHYVTGVANSWPRTRRLRFASGIQSSLAKDTVQTLVDEPSLDPGRLVGVYLSIDSFPGSASPAMAPLEGNVKIYLDGSGTPAIESSGTEDYFLGADYWTSVTAPFGSDDAKLTFKSDFTINAYRLHVVDPVCFTSGLKITWACGDSSQVNFTGTVRLVWGVWYYDE